MRIVRAVRKKLRNLLPLAHQAVFVNLSQGLYNLIKAGTYVPLVAEENPASLGRVLFIGAVVRILSDYSLLCVILNRLAHIIIR
ncbi:hypothetical protein D3C81_1643540 [compost metagenome]